MVPGSTSLASQQPPRLNLHAAAHAQQPALAPQVLGLLPDYGDPVRAGVGAGFVRLIEPTLQGWKAELPVAAVRHHEHTLQSANAVIGVDGAVITVGHQFRRMECH